MYPALQCIWMLVISRSLTELAAVVLRPPDNATVILGENATFSCELDNEVNHIQWVIAYPSRTITRIATDDADAKMKALEMQNIFLTNKVMTNQNRVSTLIITSNPTNNLTSVECIDEGELQSTEKKFFLRVISIPTKPADLQASPRNNNVFLSWLASYSPFDVPVSYMVTVKNESGMLFYYANTNSSSILYFHPRIACSEFTFSIRAFNKAGMSNQSSLSYVNPTDIEESSAIVGCSSVTVRCTLKPESNNRGCHVSLVFRDKLVMPHNLTRVNGSNIIEEDITIDSEEIVDIMVFDLKNDSTVNNVPACLQVTTLDCTSTFEPTTLPGTTGEPSNILLVIMISVPAGIAVAILMAAIITISCCVVTIIKKKGSKLGRYGSGNGATLYTYHQNSHHGDLERRPSATLPRVTSDENYDELSHPRSFLDPTGLKESQLYARIDKETPEPIYSEISPAHPWAHSSATLSVRTPSHAARKQPRSDDTYSQLGMESEYAILNSQPLPSRSYSVEGLKLY